MVITDSTLAGAALLGTIVGGCGAAAAAETWWERRKRTHARRRRPGLAVAVPALPAPTVQGRPAVPYTRLYDQDAAR